MKENSNPSDIRVCIARVAGTNRDGDVKRCIEHLGIDAEILHFSDFMQKRKSLNDYHGLVFPGGFAYGDYIRAGAIWASKIKSSLLHDLQKFVEEGKPILGICNGFQVLVESGLLPGIDGVSEYPQVALSNNASGRFECRWIHLKNVNGGKCIFIEKLKRNSTIMLPVAHAEGRFLMNNSSRKKMLESLVKNDQIVFKYATEDGTEARGHYPQNPNGSLDDIAGICDKTGLILGLMPHPEDAFFGYQLPHWQNLPKVPKHGPGFSLFESFVKYISMRN
jgi:phosphoribosylformylglycinamidine synthase